MEIKIHYDFTDGTELSYVEGLEAIDLNLSFTTNCFEFFTSDRSCEVIVEKASGRYISMQEVLANDNFYTRKHIRKAHNLRKMLVAGGFKWKGDIISPNQQMINTIDPLILNQFNDTEGRGLKDHEIGALVNVLSIHLSKYIKLGFLREAISTVTKKFLNDTGLRYNN
jgi:hypothetical protein